MSYACSGSDDGTIRVWDSVPLAPSTSGGEGGRGRGGQSAMTSSSGAAAAPGALAYYPEERNDEDPMDGDDGEFPPKSDRPLLAAETSSSNGLHQQQRALVTFRSTALKVRGRHEGT